MKLNDSSLNWQNLSLREIFQHMYIIVEICLLRMNGIFHPPVQEFAVEKFKLSSSVNSKSEMLQVQISF